jgi:hypothetical protein
VPKKAARIVPRHGKRVRPVASILSGRLTNLDSMFGLGAGIGGPVGGWMNDTFGWYAEQTWCP